MRINVIITDVTSPAQTVNDFLTSYIPNDKSIFVKQMAGEISPNIVKISACITQIDDDELIPGWFINCNGKFFFNNGVLQ